MQVTREMVPTLCRRVHKNNRDTFRYFYGFVIQNQQTIILGFLNIVTQKAMFFCVFLRGGV